MWQDTAMMVAGIAFVPALVVSIRKKTKVPLGTSLPTALALTIITICVATLGLYQSAIMDGSTAICWWVLVKQRR